MFQRRRMIRAERALNRGNTGRAAHRFHRLADQLERRGDYAQAAAVRIEAAYAEALGDDAAGAVRSTNFALTALTHLDMVGSPAIRYSLGQIAPAASQVANLLRQNGHSAEAAQVEQMLNQAFQAVGMSANQPVAPAPPAAASGAAPTHGDLPPTCGSCGGPLLPDVVEWRDPRTAVCPFCGSVVKAQ